MNNKHYIVCIHYYEEGDPDVSPATPRLYYAPTLERAKNRLDMEFSKTLANYVREHGVDTSVDGDDFSAWMSDEKDRYEIQADGFFFEKGEILEAEEA